VADDGLDNMELGLVVQEGLMIWEDWQKNFVDETEVWNRLHRVQSAVQKGI